MVRTLQISYDDSVLLETSLPAEDFEREAKLLLAAKLFEMGRMSSGMATELCGMSRAAFPMSLPRVGVSLSYGRKTPSMRSPLPVEAERGGHQTGTIG
jgi:predicted HTH domain antitoxin